LVEDGRGKIGAAQGIGKRHSAADASEKGFHPLEDQLVLLGAIALSGNLQAPFNPVSPVSGSFFQALLFLKGRVRVGIEIGGDVLCPSATITNVEVIDLSRSPSFCNDRQ
jgi:hypothetical protein